MRGRTCGAARFVGCAAVAGLLGGCSADLSALAWHQSVRGHTVRPTAVRVTDSGPWEPSDRDAVATVPVEPPTERR